MPELPEVETTCNGINERALGCVITEVHVKQFQLRYPVPKNISVLVKGKQIKEVKRRGKYGLIKLSNDFSIVFHLGMSGNIQIRSSNDIVHKKHDHVIFHLDKNYIMVFNDPRKFGFVDVLSKDSLLLNNSLNRLGPEPLSKEFNKEYLRKALSKKTINIKGAIMDQSIIAGLGNIYANEALFIANILPTKPSNNLDAIEYTKLVKSIKKVLLKAINLGGSSLKDYTGSDGKLGYFQTKFFVYNKENLLCNICETSIKKISQSGRSTYYCNKCQK